VALLPPVEWVRSTDNSPNGNCVEVAVLPSREVAMRNSRDPQGVALVFTQDEVAAFLASAKQGELDFLLH
jgi:hypothetical protein